MQFRTRSGTTQVKEDELASVNATEADCFKQQKKVENIKTYRDFNSVWRMNTGPKPSHVVKILY